MSTLRNLFLYGTLTDLEILERILCLSRPLDAARLTPATLSGYRRGYIVGRDFPGLAPAPEGETEGLLLSAMTRTEGMRLNRYEGPHYRLAAVEVRTAAAPDIRIAAHAYVIKPGQRLGADWDLESWRHFHKADYMRRWFG